jgi:signal transduction histidine kinase
MDRRRHVEEFDVCAMLSERINRLVRQRWPGIVVVTDFDPDGFSLNTFGDRLWRAARHIVRNAADAMEEKGTLTIRTRKRGDKFEIQVEDTGSGVPKELQDVLLTGPYSTKGGLHDRGYGLLIARQLIESIGGEIRILPQKPDRGAVFCLVLPLKQESLT